MDRDDFREFTVMRLGAASKLEVTEEGADYTYATLPDEGEPGPRLRIFAKLFRVTEEALANDRVGALEGIADAMVRGAIEAMRDELVKPLTANAGAGQTMRDGVALFDAAHGNVLASGSPISSATLGAMVTKLRRQTGAGGERLNLTPRFLIVPPELETTARQFTLKLPRRPRPMSTRSLGIWTGLSNRGLWTLRSTPTVRAAVMQP
jgi:hypothetical protein